MTTDVLVGLVMVVLFVAFLFIPSFWLFKKIQEQPKRSVWRKIADAVLLPFNFGALFLENRRIEQLPFYYRWFLKFTRWTSRIQYFHFLPKAIIAFLAEWLILFFTGEDVLTAIVFSWSVLFLIIITWVESKSGEMESEIVVFANKLFLYTVSMLSLFLILVHAFLWDSVQASFYTPFWKFMAHAAHEFNAFLWNTFLFFINLPAIWQFSIAFVLVIYMLSFSYISAPKEDKKEEKKEETEKE